MIRQTRRRHFSGLIAALFLVVTPWPALAQTVTPQAEGIARFVEVTGTATIDAVPDLAWLTVGVTTQERDAARAMTENATAMQALFAIIAEAGVAPSDVATTQIALYPVWERDSVRNRAPEISGYRAQNSVTVTLRDIAALGPLLDSLVKGGAREIAGIGFGLSDRDALMVAARRAAMADAIARAQLYAEAAGARLGPVLTIREQSYSAVPSYAPQRAMVTAEAVPVAPGETGITATVSAVFALE
ncbi:MAG: SIMPL domain-containing protein [Pseudomonadota bacterium]